MILFKMNKTLAVCAIFLVIIIFIIASMVWKTKKYECTYLEYTPTLMHSGYGYSEVSENNEYMADALNNGYVFKLNPEDSPDLEIGDEVVTESYKIGANYLDENQALVIYGIIPYRYLYWSLDAYEHSKVGGKFKMKNLNQTVSSVSLSGQSNDKVIVIMTKNKMMYDYLCKRMYEELNEHNSGYRINVLPMYIHKPFTSHNSKYCIMSRVILRDSKEYMPKWNARLYTVSKIPFAVPPVLECSKRNHKEHDETKIISRDVWKSVPEQYYTKQRIVSNYENYKVKVKKEDEVVDYSPNITYLESEIVCTDHDDHIDIFSIDHGRSRKGYVSTITALDIDTNHIVFTNITSDYQLKRTPTHGKLHSIISTFQPGKRRLKIYEKIYCDVATHVGPNPKTIHWMQVFKRN